MIRPQISGYMPRKWKKIRELGLWEGENECDRGDDIKNADRPVTRGDHSVAETSRIAIQSRFPKVCEPAGGRSDVAEGVSPPGGLPPKPFE